MSGAYLWHWLAPVAAAPFVGSFLGVIAERLPAGRPVLIARSACPACDHRLGARDLVPVLSWLFNRGRCRHCGAALGLFYPGIELAALVLALWAAAVVSGWLLWASCALGWVLLALAVIGGDTQQFTRVLKHRPYAARKRIVWPQNNRVLLAAE